MPRSAITPLLIDKPPVIVVAIPKVFVPLPERIKLENDAEVVPPIDCAAPTKLVWLAANGAKVPLLAKLPLMFNMLVALLAKLSVAPELIVILLQAAVVDKIAGWKGVPVGITTFVEDVGTTPRTSLQQQTSLYLSYLTIDRLYILK